MTIFEKFQEAIYDVLGYIIPSIIVVVYIIPLLLTNLNPMKKNIYLPSEAILQFNDYRELVPLWEHEYKVQHVLILFIGLYMIGHLIRAIATIFYKKFGKNRITFYKSRKEKKEKVFGPLKSKAIKYVKDQFSLNDEEEELKDLTYSYARSIIRTNGISTLVQKYIAKYNFYRSLSAIFLLISFDFGFLIIKELLINLSVGSNAILILILSLSFHFTCDYEFCRHLELADKEALFGLVHYLNNN